MHRSFASLAAPLVLCACSNSSNPGFAPTGGVTDAAADVTVDAPEDATEEADEGSDVTLPDVMCTVPGAASDTTSTQCTPDGPGSWTCEGQSGSGWIYSCQGTTAGAHPSASSVGACVDFGAYDYADASYIVTLCAMAACTPAAQYDSFCSSGSAVACPADQFDAAAPASNCTPATVTQWNSGDGLPGQLYCCP